MTERRFRKTVRAREVHRELLPGQSPELLKSLHLLDREGNLHADSRRKLKQVNHLVRLLQPALDDLLKRHEEPLVVDAGAGNAYLGFILYELFFGAEGRGRVLGVESQPVLVRQVRERAAALGYERLDAVAAKVEAASLPERVHMVVALHACDTATDDALAAAVSKGADWIAVVPCCQAEAARLLKEAGKAGDPAVWPLWRHAWHRREFGSHFTNVVRALVLEAHGYKVTVTELTGWEHSVKNELILARRVHRENPRARRHLEELLERVPARIKLVRTLYDEAAAQDAAEARPGGSPGGEERPGGSPGAEDRPELPDGGPGPV